MPRGPIQSTAPISPQLVSSHVFALLSLLALLLAGCGGEANLEDATSQDAEPAVAGDVPGLSRAGDSTFRGDGYQFQIADNWFEKSKRDSASVEDLGVGGAAARKIKVEGSLIDAIPGEYAANLGLTSAAAPRGTTRSASPRITSVS